MGLFNGRFGTWAKRLLGGEWENQTPKNIAIKYARDPNWAPVFNYASMAHNNHFFFKNLHPNPPPMPEVLEKELVDSFGSIETLKREFVITASSMFGPGFVWLVKEQPKKYSILCTYLAGSPYPGAHYRKQPVDMNTEDTTLPEHVRRMVREAPVNTVGAHGPRSQRAKPLAPGGIDLLPVLCLNMWEHVYLPDYGVGAFGEGGKMGYAERWWDFIDWDAVAKGAQAGQSVQYES